MAGPQGQRAYEVRPGDTLSTIVRRHYPDAEAGPGLLREIVRANPHAFPRGNADFLLAGVRITLPGGPAEVTPSAAYHGEPEAPRETASEAPPVAEDGGTLRILSGEEERSLQVPLTLSRSLDRRLDEAIVAAAAEAAQGLESGEPSREPEAETIATSADAGEVAAAREAMIRAREARAAARSELAEARARLQEMEQEISALTVRIAQLSDAMAARPAPVATVPPWVWVLVAIAGGAVLVAAFLVARGGQGRRDADDDILAAAPGIAGGASVRDPFASEESPAAPGSAPEPRLARASRPAWDEETQPAEKTVDLTGLEARVGAEDEEKGIDPLADSAYLNILSDDQGGGLADSQALENIYGGNSERSVSVRLIEVELLMLYQQYDDAERILLELIDNDRTDRPDMRPWSMAFDVYRLTGNRAAFDDLIVRFQRVYNVIPPIWTGDEPVEVDMEEHYPHLVKHLEALWGTRRGERFLNELLVDDRDGTRMGFEMSVAEDISFLRELAAFRSEHR